MWRWVTWSVCHFFCLNSFSKASSTTAWAWMSKTSPTSLTASWPIISGSITSTTLTTWGRLVCSLTGLIKLHDRFTKYQILSNSICCFVQCTFICVHLYQNELFFTSHEVVYLSLHHICLFNPHLSFFLLLVFPPSPYFCVSLHVLVWTCAFILQALMSLFVLASKDGWVNIMYHGLDAVAVDQQVMLFM